MLKQKWLAHLIIRSLAYRKARTFLLFAVLAMASSLATSLGIVSASMEGRINEEIRKYGANLVIMPERYRMSAGMGGLSFGDVGEPTYLLASDLVSAIRQTGIAADSSSHLRGSLGWKGNELPVEGVVFSEVRRLFTWWQMKGNWPTRGEAVIGSDVARIHSLAVGDYLDLVARGESIRIKISGIVSTGGEEDGLIFVDLQELQSVLGLEGRISMIRLMVFGNPGQVKAIAETLAGRLAGASVKEVKQLGHTSERLLHKVRLLMLLVTVVVVISAGSSVAGTMSTTVLERSREIGLLKAIGGSRLEVMLIFAGEALLSSIFAGFVGFFIGAGIASFILQEVFTASSQFMPLSIPLSLGTALVLSLLGSLGPMLAVFRMDPVRSLRGE